MKNEQHLIPREALTSVASGALLMALFTSMWAYIGFYNLNGLDHGLTLVIFGALVISFIVFAIYIFRAASHIPKLSSEEDKAERKRTGKWFGIIFGLEGITIPIAVNIVIALHHPNLTIPVIALIVGLHFYPMARIFGRIIDYYLATWTTAIAICSILLTLNGTFPQSYILAFLGVGVAMATSSYGLHMIYNGRRLLKRANYIGK